MCMHWVIILYSDALTRWRILKLKVWRLHTGRRETISNGINHFNNWLDTFRPPSGLTLLLLCEVKTFFFGKNSHVRRPPYKKVKSRLLHTRWERGGVGGCAEASCAIANQSLLWLGKWRTASRACSFCHQISGHVSKLGPPHADVATVSLADKCSAEETFENVLGMGTGDKNGHQCNV